jgi:hypothetical protein
MAEEQVEMLTDPDTKEQIKKQILAWEENLERLHCEQFRLKCYMASLQNGELPNPKVPTNFTEFTALVILMKFKPNYLQILTYKYLLTI